MKKKKSYTYKEGKHWPGATRWDHMRKLREFEIPNTLLELAGAEQRNFHLLTSGLIFSSTARLSFFLSFSFLFLPFFFRLLFSFLLFSLFSILFLFICIDYKDIPYFYPLAWGLYSGRLLCTLKRDSLFFSLTLSPLPFLTFSFLFFFTFFFIYLCIYIYFLGSRMLPVAGRRYGNETIYICHCVTNVYCWCRFWLLDVKRVRRMLSNLALFQ